MIMITNPSGEQQSTNYTLERKVFDSEFFPFIKDLAETIDNGVDKYCQPIILKEEGTLYVLPYPLIGDMEKVRVIVMGDCPKEVNNKLKGLG